MLLGLNRWDWRSVPRFIDSAVVAEQAGIDFCFQPVNPLAITDPYVTMALAAQATTSLRFGTLLDTPRLRPAAVAASSIATVEQVAPGRTMMVFGIGDTAVRWLNQEPATMAELELATAQTRFYLAGDEIDVGAAAPARLRHARFTEPPPVWVAAGGPKTLQMAGRVADGVFLRVGTHPANLARAIAQIDAGIADANRNRDDVRLGVIVHTCRSEDPSDIAAITRAMAAGFYEYTPSLFDPPGFEWNGTPIEELKAQLWPDFHHASDLVAAGALVDFLPDEIAASFAFFGTSGDVADQLRQVIAVDPRIDIVVPHPVPNLNPNEHSDYCRWLGQTIKPLL